MRRAVWRVAWGVMVQGWPAVVAVPEADGAVATGRLAVALALARDALPGRRARRASREAEAAARKVAELAGRVDALSVVSRRVDALAAALAEARQYAEAGCRDGRLRAVPAWRDEREARG